MVSSSFISSQIDEGNLCEDLFVLLQTYLQNCVRTRRIGVCGILRGYSEGAAVLNDVQEFLSAADDFLHESDDVDVLLIVLSYLEFCPVIE